MKYRPFGQTGLEVSEIVFGCGAVGGLMINASDEVRQDAFDLAVTSGINWFDTAEYYGHGESEKNLSRTLQALNVDPGEIVVATKWWPIFKHNCRRRLPTGIP